MLTYTQMFNQFLCPTHHIPIVHMLHATIFKIIACWCRVMSVENVSEHGMVPIAVDIPQELQSALVFHDLFDLVVHTVDYQTVYSHLCVQLRNSRVVSKRIDLDFNIAQFSNKCWVNQPTVSECVCVKLTCHATLGFTPKRSIKYSCPTVICTMESQVN